MRELRQKVKLSFSLAEDVADHDPNDVLSHTFSVPGTLSCSQCLVTAAFVILRVASGGQARCSRLSMIWSVP